MKLSDLLNEIKSQLDEIGSCGAFLIRENPDKKDDFLEIPIKELVLDEDDNEINIFGDDAHSENFNSDRLMNVKQLYKLLMGFMPDAANCEIYASHLTIELDSEYWARLDVPIVAYGMNESETRFGLLEEASDST